MAEKAMKERDRTQMPVAKKERPQQTTNAGGKHKMAALISQANSWHQMKETKQLKPPQNPKRLPTCKHKVEKKEKNNTTKSQQSNRLLSATKEWTTTVRRTQSKNNCANDKQMESQTNHN